MTNNLTSQKYWNICGFLNDEEVHKIYDIIDNALDRACWVGLADNGELSIRIYDDNLKQNIDADSEYEPEPCEPDHPFFTTTNSMDKTNLHPNLLVNSKVSMLRESLTTWTLRT